MADNTSKQSNIHRRDFLRTLAGGAIVLVSGDMLAGCGGGSIFLLR